MKNKLKNEETYENFVESIQSLGGKVIKAKNGTIIALQVKNEPFSNQATIYAKSNEISYDIGQESFVNSFVDRESCYRDIINKFSLDKV